MDSWIVVKSHFGINMKAVNTESTLKGPLSDVTFHYIPYLLFLVLRVKKVRT